MTPVDDLNFVVFLNIFLNKFHEKNIYNFCNLYGG